MKAGGYIVTGASSGIGEAVARQLLDRDENVLLVARRKEILEGLARLFPKASVFATDLLVSGSAVAVAKSAKECFGVVKGFVHCAGFVAPAPLGMIDEKTVMDLYKVHAIFPMMFLGWMARKPNHIEGASAVLVSSRSSCEADIGNAAYASAKGAVNGLYTTARVELAMRGVRLELYAPAEVDTPMARKTWMTTATPERMVEIMARHPDGLPSAHDAAKDIITLLDGGER